MQQVTHQSRRQRAAIIAANAKAPAPADVPPIRNSHATLLNKLSAFEQGHRTFHIRVGVLEREGRTK